jgi:hypothetical protein
MVAAGFWHRGIVNSSIEGIVKRYQSCASKRHVFDIIVRRSGLRAANRRLNRIRAPLINAGTSFYQSGPRKIRYDVPLPKLPSRQFQ